MCEPLQNADHWVGNVQYILLCDSCGSVLPHSYFCHTPQQILLPNCCYHQVELNVVVAIVSGIGLIPMEAAYLVSWRHQNALLSRFLLKTSFHCLLSFTFLPFLIYLPLYSAVSSVCWCPFYLFSTYIWNIQWRWSLHKRTLCGLLSCDSSPMCRKCCCVFAHNYTLDDDSEHPMDYVLYLLPKGIYIIMHEWLGIVFYGMFTGVVDSTSDQSKTLKV